MTVIVKPVFECLSAPPVRPDCWVHRSIHTCACMSTPLGLAVQFGDYTAPKP